MLDPRNWTGQVYSDWSRSDNWDSTFPRQTDDGIINAVTPNSTVITTRGAQAQDLSVGVSRTGMLVIQNGRPLADSFGIIGNLPGWGRATVTGVGSS